MLRREMEEGVMKIGDQVKISMERNNCFEFQTSPFIHAQIVHIPQDTGDSFIFTSPFCPEFIINPSSSSFIGMVVIPPES